MVGYILGLGDRHPSNLMIDRKNGCIMHVDFGDCFEVAITRDRFPECVPFRLTRMLVSALEISGVHGTFRITCENTMAVLRDNADSVMAVLEAFVHDPLIDWFAKSHHREFLGLLLRGLGRGAREGEGDLDVNMSFTYRTFFFLCCSQSIPGRWRPAGWRRPGPGRSRGQPAGAQSRHGPQLRAAGRRRHVQRCSPHEPNWRRCQPQGVGRHFACEGQAYGPRL